MNTEPGATGQPLREVCREEIWKMLTQQERTDIKSLIDTFWSDEDRRTLPLDITVGGCVYRKPRQE